MNNTSNEPASDSIKKLCPLRVTPETAVKSSNLVSL